MTATVAPRLSAHGLVFAYPGRPLFNAWSHEFGAGLTWVRGHNGCGKSTLLRLLGGVLDPLAGHLQLDNIDAKNQPLDYRRQVYWCGPDGVAFDHLKPTEYFGFVAGLYPRFSTGEAAVLVEALGLAPFLNQRISRLSTGTQRKVAVIAAIAAGTSAVLLDEPLAALDQASLSVLRSYLAKTATQTDRIWIVTSHEPLGDADLRAAVLDLPRTEPA
ncbi:MAG: ATP-binding cassette domain-containing protein [Rhizobacter sp.]